MHKYIASILLLAGFLSGCEVEFVKRVENPSSIKENALIEIRKDTPKQEDISVEVDEEEDVEEEVLEETQPQDEIEINSADSKEDQKDPISEETMESDTIEKIMEEL